MREMRLRVRFEMTIVLAMNKSDSSDMICCFDTFFISVLSIVLLLCLRFLLFWVWLFFLNRFFSNDFFSFDLIIIDIRCFENEERREKKIWNELERWWDDYDAIVSREACNKNREMCKKDEESNRRIFFYSWFAILTMNNLFRHAWIKLKQTRSHVILTRHF